MADARTPSGGSDGGEGSVSTAQSSRHQARLEGWKALVGGEAAAEIQAGGQGRVLRVVDGKLPIAVKYMTSDKNTAVRAEIRSLRRVNNGHPHIVQSYGYLRGGSGSLYLFLECGSSDGHDAAGWAPAGDRCLGAGTHMREWLLQLAHALSFSHSMGVAHRDIKPENMLLVQLRVDGAHASTGNAVAGGKRDRSALSKLIAAATKGDDSSAEALRAGYVAKLCDFGSAFLRRADKPEAPARSACGSSYYCSPAVRRLISMKLHKEDAEQAWPPGLYDWKGLQETGYNAFTADVWSYGMMVFTLVTGLKPFRAPAITDPRFRSFVQQTQPHVLQDELLSPTSTLWSTPSKTAWRWPSALPLSLVDLLKRCLRVRPSERCTMAEVLQHPWYSDPTWVPPDMSVEPPYAAGSGVMSGTASTSSDIMSASSSTRRGMSTAGKDRVSALSMHSGSSVYSAMSGGSSLLTPKEPSPGGFALPHLLSPTGGGSFEVNPSASLGAPSPFSPVAPAVAAGARVGERAAHRAAQASPAPSPAPGSARGPARGRGSAPGAAAAAQGASGRSALLLPALGKPGPARGGIRSVQ